MDFWRIAAAVVLTLLLASGVSAAPQFLRPIDQTSGNYQASFGSTGEGDGERLWFEADLSNVDSDGTLYLYEKDAHDKTFNQVDSVEVFSTYTDQQYLFNVTDEWQDSVGESTTVLINDNEHTFEVDSVQSSTQAALYVDGELDNYYEGDLIYLEGSDNTPVRIHEIIYTGDSSSTVTYQMFGKRHVPEFEHSYRVEYDAGTYSEQIYLSVDTDDETPYLDTTNIDGKRIRDFNRRTVTPLSSVEANIRQDQGDDFNLSLYDQNTGDLIAWSKTNGTSDNTYVHVVKDTFYDLAQIVIDTSSNQRFEFPTTGSSLLEAANHDDSYYFHIEDIDDNSDRFTPIFQTHTSGSNDPPNITAIEGYNGSSWKPLTDFTTYGESLSKIRVSVDDSNNKFHGAKLYLEDTTDAQTRLNYTTDFVVKDNNIYTFNIDQTINDSGNWEAAINVTDGDAEDKKAVTWTVPWGNWTNSSFTINGSTQDLQINRNHNFTVNFTAKCVGGECQNTDDYSTAQLQTAGTGTIQECSATPFCHYSSNPQNTSSGELPPQTSRSFAWTLNATGDTGNYTLSSNISSSHSEVQSADSDQRTVEITVDDVTPPETRNPAQSSDSVGQGSSVNISAEGKDNYELEQAYLWTNETGSFQRKSGVYGSPVSLNASDSYETAEFSWSNASVEVGTVAWKIQFFDTSGNAANTSIETFTVTQPVYIQDVEIRIDQIGDSESFFGRAFLTGESQIADHKPIAADTVSFSDSLWEFENFSAPFSDDLRVNDTNGVNSKNYTVDFDTTTYPLEAANTGWSNLSRQLVQRFFEVQNNGDAAEYNLSYADPGTPVNRTEDAVNVSSGGTVNHSARWANDYLNHSSFQFRIPTSEVVLDQDYIGVKPVQITENGGYDWTTINTNGSVSEPSVCIQVNGSSVSVPAASTVNRSIRFSCNPGTAGTPTLDSWTSDDVEHFNYSTTLTVASELTSEKRITWRINDSNLNKWSERDAGSAVAVVNGSKYDIELVDGPGYVDVTVQDDFSNSSLHEDSYPAYLHWTVGSGSTSGGTGGTGGSGGSSDDGITILPDPDRAITFTGHAFKADYGTTRKRWMRIKNTANENITVELTIPPQQKQPGCQYFQVQKQKGHHLATVNSVGKHGVYRLPPSTTGDNFRQFSDLRIIVEVTMPDKEDLGDTETISCQPEVTVSNTNATAEDLVLQARQGQRFGEWLTSFFANLGIPDEPFGLFQDVCTNTERNTAENPDELPCSERRQSSLSVSMTVVAAVAVFGLAAFIMATYGRLLLRILRGFLPF